MRICTVDEIERHAHIIPSRVLKIEKTGLGFDKTRIITVANVFSWFLQFISRFLSVLKTDTVPVFESLLPSTHFF
jgi:hypothetical protein